MVHEELVMALAKALVAAAWADGELTHDEINCMKDLLFHLPRLSARQWASVSMYIEMPVAEEERTRLVAELQDAIRTDRDKQLAVRALDDMAAVACGPAAEDREIATQIKAAIESVDVSLLSRLVKGMAGRRSQALANAPNREDHFEDFLKNKVYYGLRRRLDMGQADLDLPDDTLWVLGLAGGLMAQIAHVNPLITDGERATMKSALQHHWHLTSMQADFVVEVAVSETATLLDRTRLAREFAAASTHRERLEFLDVLFALAAADGMATYDEIEEIRHMARSLRLTHREFIAAKLRIPRHQRAQ